MRESKGEVERDREDERERESVGKEEISYWFRKERKEKEEKKKMKKIKKVSVSVRDKEIDREGGERE